jgi:CheY-like chemotaxis protein
LCPDANTAVADNVMVLVVEDEADTRETVKEALELTGYHVRTAENGREALDVLTQVQPSDRVIMLLDLFMPVMDGWEFRREQLKDDLLRHIPVVVMTGASVYAGIDANIIVHKPLDVARFVSIIERYF